MMFCSGRTYIAQECDGGVKVTVRLEGVDNSNAEVFMTDNSFFDSLDTLMEKHDVKSWDGFRGNAVGVLDGERFSFSAVLKDGSTIGASGYMQYPKGFGAFREDVTELFIKLYETRHPNYRRMLETYLKEKLVPEYGPIIKGAAFEYGFISGENRMYSYEKDNLSEGILFCWIGNMHRTDRSRDARDMAVVYTDKAEIDGGYINTRLHAAFYTVNDDKEVISLGNTMLSNNLFWNESVSARFFTKSIDISDKNALFSFGFIMHATKVFADKPERYLVHLFSFDGTDMYIDLSKAIYALSDGSNLSENLHKEMAAAAEELGYTGTAKKWLSGPRHIEIEPAEIGSYMSIMAFGSVSDLYEKLGETPPGELVEGIRIKGFVR